MSNTLIQEMLESYHCQSSQDYLNALRETLQNVALLGLYRGGFFQRGAFYGGTALRILYGLNRGSEDLDFSLLQTNETFDLGEYSDVLVREFAAFGLEVTFMPKIKMSKTNIQAGFLKSGTQAQMLSIGLDRSIASQINSRNEIKIKVEVDVDPPEGFDTEIKYVYQPIPFPVRAYTLPCLLAGKLHAVLFRAWKSRVKGRDWYDLAWYAGKHPQYSLRHLEARVCQSGDYVSTATFTADIVQMLLQKRLEAIDIEALKLDVLPFLRDARDVDFWSREYFSDVFRHLEAI